MSDDVAPAVYLASSDDIAIFKMMINNGKVAMRFGRQHELRQCQQRMPYWACIFQSQVEHGVAPLIQKVELHHQVFQVSAEETDEQYVKETARTLTYHFRAVCFFGHLHTLGIVDLNASALARRPVWQ